MFENYSRYDPNYGNFLLLSSSLHGTDEKFNLGCDRGDRGTGTSNWVMNEVDRKEGRAKPFPGFVPARQRQTEVKRG